MEQMPFSNLEFAENPEPRVPCVLVLDVSGSMVGQPIEELNRGLVAYRDALVADPLAAKRVEISIITFGSRVDTVCDFVTVDRFEPPMLAADGLTHMGEAVNRAIDSLESRKRSYRDNGIAYYRPWLFLISDGAPNDPGWELAAARAVACEDTKAFKTFCIGVGNADVQTLGRFSRSEPLRLQGLMFRDMFLWLSRSQKSVSRSNIGDSVPLENPTGPKGWGSID